MEAALSIAETSGSIAERLFMRPKSEHLDYPEYSGSTVHPDGVILGLNLGVNPLDPFDLYSYCYRVHLTFVYGNHV